MKLLELSAGEADAGLRLDVFLSRAGELSRSAAARLCDGGLVTVNGRPAKKNLPLAAGDEVKASIPLPAAPEARAEDIPISVVYEDGELLVVDKPQGMVVHPAAGHWDGTLVNALLARCGDSLSGINGVMRPGIVHRIDKDTSGLLIVAKSDRAHAGLAEQIKEHSFTRVYEAVAAGRFREENGRVELPIGRHHTDRKRMAVDGDGARYAATGYEVLRAYSAFGGVWSHIRCVLETGRTHQIRLHMTALGHPLLGDPVYGGRETPSWAEKAGLHGQCIHPVTGERVVCDAPLPEHFRRILDILEKAEH